MLKDIDDLDIFNSDEVTFTDSRFLDFVFN